MRFAALLLLASSLALAQPAPLEGTVKERLDAAGYSYLRVETAKGERWAAVPQGSAEVGKRVTIEVQAEMHDFESKTLKRTWPVLSFGTLAGAPAVVPGTRQGVENPHQTSGLPTTVPSTPTLEGKVLEVLQAGAYTYARLETKQGQTWAAVPKAELAVGATARVRNPQPMDGFKSPSLGRTFERLVFGTLEP